MDVGDVVEIGLENGEHVESVALMSRVERK